ncbi:GNAT family N-acetyltransferase [Nocardioides immobilis]|uniref:GNAT family N-acetyltransferase n=1 Tax=Nocardioides immobilis TaxID=2049295 RepID=UPI0015FE2A97|nr:GNAT family N-acetyltransferase [Nocardioides immobilis]
MTESHAIPRPTVRPLTVDDFEASAALGIEAFGEIPEGVTRPTREGFPGAGRLWWGAFDGEGRLSARMLRREYDSWWHGRTLPTSGIAGVTVAAEARGGGLLRELFRAVLAASVERGDIVSTLYPTAPGIYRSAGYEVVAMLETVEVPTAELQQVRRPVGVRTRRATVADMPAVRALYDTWAAAQNGPLTRRGPSFLTTDDALVAAFTGVTLAVDDAGDPVGYCLWNRGRGYGAGAKIDVVDLIATTADGYQALWRLLGSFASVAPHVHVVTSGADVARLLLPTLGWRVVESRPYMLRLLDMPAAFAALPGPGFRAEVAFRVHQDSIAGTEGDYRLLLTDDGVACAPGNGGRDIATFTPGGLALLWSGAQTCANIRMAGLLQGGTPEDDAVLDAACAGRPLHVRDYF